MITCWIIWLSGTVNLSILYNFFLLYIRNIICLRNTSSHFKGRLGKFYTNLEDKFIKPQPGPDVTFLNTHLSTEVNVLQPFLVEIFMALCIVCWVFVCMHTCVLTCTCIHMCMSLCIYSNSYDTYLTKQIPRMVSIRIVHNHTSCLSTDMRELPASHSVAHISKCRQCWSNDYHDSCHVLWMRLWWSDRDRCQDCCRPCCALVFSTWPV